MFSFDFLQNLDLLSVGVAIAASFILGFTVFIHNRKSLTSRAFLFFVLVSSAWGIVNYLWYKFQDPLYTLSVLRMVMFFAIWQAYSFFLLVYVFPADDVILPKWIKYFISPIVVIVSFLTLLTPLVFKGVSRVANSEVSTALPGPGIPLFALTAVGLVLVGIVLMTRRAIRAGNETKHQFRYFLVGMIAMFVLIIGFNFVLPVAFQKTSFIPLGALFIFPFVAFTSYAITKGLLNVKVFSTQILVFVLSIVSLVEIVLSTSIYILFFRIAVFFLVLFFGLFLIRSVLREVQQREELQKLSTELKNVNGQLLQLDQAKSEFLSVASHQLRTPLTAIKGYASMFLSGDFGKITDAQRQNLQIIYDSAHRLAVLVSDLLDLSRIESGRMEFEFKAVNLCKIVESVIDEVSPKAAERKLYVYFDNANRTCPDVRADQEKIRQVIINLIDNAIKYTLQGGVTIRLMQTVEGQLQFSVTDTGIGVDPKEKDKLFEKFFRTQAANEVTREGTGLGIYVVKKIVAAHEGKIWFDSPGVNKGTTFYFTLPIPKGAIKAEKVTIASLEAF